MNEKPTVKKTTTDNAAKVAFLYPQPALTYTALSGPEIAHKPFIVRWTKLDTGVPVLPETALGSYSFRLECVESASKRGLVRAT